MDHERKLISKVIQTGSIAEPQEAGVRHDFFLDTRNQRVYRRISDYVTEYGAVPTLDSIKADFPNYNFIEAEEPFGDLIDRIRKAHLRQMLDAAIYEAFDALEEDRLEQVTSIFSTALGKAASDSSTMHDTDISQTGDERLARYIARSVTPDTLRGIPSGFPTIDNATLGFQPKQLVTMVGPPKAGKSTMMLLAGYNAHLLAYSPLLIGFEMTNEEQEDRLDAIASAVSLRKIKDGSLSKDDIANIRRSNHKLDNMRPFVLSNDTLSTTTLSGVQAKVEKYKPDLLLVDGIYLMQDENGEKPNSPQALTNLTRGFKRMAQNMNLPIVITTQVLESKMDKSRGVTTGSIGYSSSFAQDSDVLIGVQNEDENNLKTVKILDGRNTPRMEVTVQWDWDTMTFEEIEYDLDAEHAGADY